MWFQSCCLPTFFAAAALVRKTGSYPADENDGTDGSDGILIQNARDIRLVACSAARNGEDGIDLGGFEEHVGRDSYNVAMIDCTASDNRDDGFAVSGTNGTQFKTHDVTVRGCTSRGNGGAGIQVYQRASQVSLEKCRFVSNLRGLNFHSSAHDIAVVGCVIRDNRAENLSIDSSVKNLTMKDNVVD